MSENNENPEMDNDPVIDVPGQQVIPLRYEGGIYVGGKDQGADANDFAMALVMAALGVK